MLRPLPQKLKTQKFGVKLLLIMEQLLYLQRKHPMKHGKFLMKVGGKLLPPTCFFLPEEVEKARVAFHQFPNQKKGINGRNGVGNKRRDIFALRGILLWGEQ
jgi:hypothetical protein